MSNGGGGGGTPCYEHIRSLPVDEELRIERAVVKVYPESDFMKARWEFEYEVSGTSTTNPCRAFWWYLPDKHDGQIEARDAHGTLQVDMLREDHRQKVYVKFREPLQVNERYEFEFIYKAPMPSTVVNSGFRKTIASHLWLSYSIPLEELQFRVFLPESISCLSSSPPHDSSLDNVLGFERRNLRPREEYRVSLLCSSTPLGKPIVLSALDKVLTLIAGALLSYAVNASRGVWMIVPALVLAIGLPLLFFLKRKRK